MSANPLLDLYRRQVKAAEEVKETWKVDHVDATLAQVVEGVIVLLCDLVAKYVALHRQSWVHLTKSPQPIHAVNVLGRELADSFTELVLLANDFVQLGEQYEQQGYRCARLGELKSATARLANLAEEHAGSWPYYTEEDARQTQEEIARGEVLPLDEAFAAMAGVSKEEWEQRVQAHLAKYPRTDP